MVDSQTKTAKKGNRANMTDLFIFIIIVLIISNNPSLSTYLRIALILVYPLIFIPIAMILGGTPGQRLLGLKLRKKEDHDRFISLKNAYARVALVLLDYTIGIGGKPADKTPEHDDKTQYIAFFTDRRAARSVTGWSIAQWVERKQNERHCG